MSLDEATRNELIKKCLEMRLKAYAPYSNYLVGAALLTEDNKIFGGCNIENSSYGACNCAERTAIFKAVSEGAKKLKAIAITGGKRDTKQTGGDLDYAFPCGICRQVIREFCSPKEMVVIVCKNEKEFQQYTLEEILPHSFGPEHLL